MSHPLDDVGGADFEDKIEEGDRNHDRRKEDEMTPQEQPEEGWHTTPNLPKEITDTYHPKQEQWMEEAVENAVAGIKDSIKLLGDFPEGTGVEIDVPRIRSGLLTLFQSQLEAAEKRGYERGRIDEVKALDKAMEEAKREEREKLKQYCQHLDNCDTRWEINDEECTCGLASLTNHN